MTRPPDRIPMLGGVVYELVQLREVARLANLAGIEGYRVENVTTAMDIARYQSHGELRSYITITYREKPE
jgi:hypothetical protein